MKIKELKVDLEVEITALLSKMMVGTSNNNKKYLSLLLSDNTGSIDAKYWDVPEKLIEKLKPGTIYKFKGSIISYRNNLQLKIKNCENIDISTIKVDDFLEKAPINIEKEYENIVNTINSFSNITYKKILLEVIKKFGKDFKVWPAATKFHHNIKSGLLWHTSGMLKMAKAVSKVYTKAIIDTDLLFAGVILHDIGKILELNSAEVSEYTLRGKLMGHISIMNAQLQVIINNGKYDEESTILLQHMILASHGKMEFGSPVMPHIIEAEILTLLDNLDARIFSISSEYIKSDPKSFTNKLMPLEQRWFYNHKEKK